MSPLKILYGCCAALAVTLVNDPAAATSVFASAGDPLQVGVPTGGGTLDLLVHTDQTGPPPVGPNASTFDTGSGPPPFGPAGLFTGEIGGWLPGTGYSPIVGFKGTKGAQRTVSSTSGMANAVATFVPAGAIPGFPGGLLLASASTPLPGTAAALADDPYSVLPGTYSYSAVIDEFTLNTLGGGAAGARYFATDSRFSDALWQLTIGSTTSTADPSGLFVEFTSNQVLQLTDSQVESNVRTALAQSGSTHLEAFNLFSTSYTVDRPIQYGFGVEGDAVLVPEPSSISLLGFGVAALAMVRFRRRPASQAGAAAGRRSPPAEGTEKNRSGANPFLITPAGCYPRSGAARRSIWPSDIYATLRL
jgi:hypothetical protein